jgi:histidinol-phosphate aminotransferase
MFELNNILRDNIRNLVPYRSARDEFHGIASIFLDANENSMGSPLSKNYNRYPDPRQILLKKKIAAIKGVPVEKIFLGNGSDECIDILIRTCCNPGIDHILVCPPTYGMYEVSAHINDVGVNKASLTETFQLNLESIEKEINHLTKIIFLCSPNNPTGNCLNRQDVETILNSFNGLVILDEAYINFARQKSFLQELDEYPNLVVMQTLSKAWGLAALRIGMIFSTPELIEVCSRIKPPYNLGQPSQELALQALEQVELVNERIREIVGERERLAKSLAGLSLIQHIYASEANFLLVKMANPRQIYLYLLERGIVVRDRSNVKLCGGCLRITVGTAAQNDQLIETLTKYSA